MKNKVGHTSSTILNSCSFQRKRLSFQNLYSILLTQALCIFFSDFILHRLRFRYYFQKALCLCCFTNNTFNSETYSRKYSVSHMTHYNVNDRRVSINNDGRRMSSNSPMGRKLSSISFVPGEIVLEPEILLTTG